VIQEISSCQRQEVKKSKQLGSNITACGFIKLPFIERKKEKKGAVKSFKSAFFRDRVRGGTRSKK